MRGIKPFKLSFITRPFQWGREHQLGIGILAYFDLGTLKLHTDMEMWTELASVMGKDLVPDVGMPKSSAEFLVVGSAYQPGGVPGPLRRVRVQVGGIEKILYVVGDREWKGGVPTEPVPFVEMPITWANAFGGEAWAKNPLGKGFAPVKGEDGVERHALPNVELPGKMIDSLKDRPDPASFGPIDFTWPQRFSLGGTYDKEWFDTRFPGFAKDMDWRIWNVAAPDQWQETPFVGGEPIVLEHLHPTQQKIESRIPEIRARCLVQMVGASAPIEVPVRLTTLWIIPSLGRGVLVWHGAQPCAEDDAADVDALMVAGEDLDAPRSFEHYRSIFEKRLGPDRALEVLNDEEIVPRGQAGMGGEVEKHLEVTGPKGFAQERQQAAAAEQIEAIRARLVAIGMNPDEHGPLPPPPIEKPPELSKLAEFRAKKMEEAEKKMEEMKAHREHIRAEIKEFYDEAGLDYEHLTLETTELGRRGPPVFTADGERARMRKLADEAAARGTPVAELEFYATDETWYARWKEGEAQELASYRLAAHTQKPAYALAPELSEARRQAVGEAARAGQSMAGWNLTGADLSGLDLSNADLTGALMESTRLVGARLAGARMSNVVLAHACLEGAIFDGADLSRANLGKSVLTRASFRVANLDHAILDGATLEQTSFEHAHLPNLTLNETELTRVDFAGAVLANATFLKTRLSEVRFCGAVLQKASFVEVNASGLDFSHANLEDATLVSFNAPGAKLAGARMIGMRFITGGSVEGGDLSYADMRRANLRGVILAGANLRGSLLDGADLSEADLSRAQLQGVRARQSMWIRTNLGGAVATNADFFEAMFSKADIRGTNLRGANLYGADFALVRGDETTNISGCIMDRVRAKPVREVAPPPERAQ
jgi:uncharacterized protein YjbI with pentapeptide repeats